MQVITTGYKPRFHQEILHSKLNRFNVIVCHRRFGKTVFSINEMIDQALRQTKRNPHYAYVGPSYGQVKRVAWDYIKEFTRNIPGVKFNEAELRVEIQRPHMADKITIWLLSGENPDSLRGIYLDGVILDEYAEMNPVVWTQVLRPALSDRKGWAIFIGTPKGKNHFHEMHTLAKSLTNEGWFTVILKASQTGVVDSNELRDARNTMSAEEYAQEYECDFGAALVGAYYGRHMADVEKAKHITNVPHDPRYPVLTFWDLGIDDHTAIWMMQEVGREFHFIDYYEATNKDFVQIHRDLMALPYDIETLELPHDAEQRELSNGNSRRETLFALFNPNLPAGKQPRVKVNVIPRHKVEDGINAVRMMLPRCWFDKVKCKLGIEALQNYQRKWDPKDKIFIAEPLHNWASHGADGFRQFGMGYREAFRRNLSDLPREADRHYNVLDY